MALELPESMEELVYWTKRKIGNGEIKAWVEKGFCPKCGEGLMGKPKGPDGKVQIRAKIYVCDKCKNTEDKKEYEETLTANIIYTCPECKHHGEKQVPYKRKKYKGVDALIFTCEQCNAKIAITKKMKAIKN